MSDQHLSLGYKEQSQEDCYFTLADHKATNLQIMNNSFKQGTQSYSLSLLFQFIDIEPRSKNMNFCTQQDSLQLLVRCMQLKKYSTNQNAKVNSFRQSVKVVGTLQISPNESQRKSNTSTHLSQRSSSARKILIPKSQKLTNFFNESIRERSLRKGMNSAQPNQTLSSRFRNQKPTNVPERIQFLRYNINKDYFDDENDSKPLKDKAEKQLNVNKKRQNQQRYRIFRENPMSQCTTSGENSYSAKKGIKSEKEIVKPKRMKSPRTLVHPVAKIMEKSRGYGKMHSARSLEYTFGLP